jgi:hypothetical protein
MAILLGVATFSKPTIAGLFAAPAVFWLFRLVGGSRLRRTSHAAGEGAGATFARHLICAAVFVLVGGGLFAVNYAVTGEWNYQGGQRLSYYYEFPFQTEGSTTLTGAEKSRNELVLPEVAFNPRTFTSNLAHNLVYFFVGRYAGLLPYFFPGVFAMLLMLASPRRRPLWQWLVLAASLAQGLVFVVFLAPYTWSGGGVANRYFFAGYGVMLFLLPPVETIATALVPWIVGGLFVAPWVLNPFTASFKPAEIAKAGPLRALPIDLTLLNDLPVFTEGAERSRVEFGGIAGNDPTFLVSFLDDNAYGREEDRSFWTRGDSRADIVYKVGGPMSAATFEITAGPVPADVRIAVDGQSASAHLNPGERRRLSIPMKGGLPYEKEVQGARLHTVRISTTGGFTPIFFDTNSSDPRYLGVRVRPGLVPQ